MYELAPNDFLFLFYSRLSIKLKRILELTNNNKRTLSETIELFETKDKIITAIDMLAMESNDETLKESYSTLARLIVSTDPKHISAAIDFCASCKVHETNYD